MTPRCPLAAGKLQIPLPGTSVINCCFSPGEMLGTIVMLELSLDQQQEAGLFLRAQRRPAPSWFILLLLLLLQMVEYSEIDGVDSIIIKVSLAEFVNVIDYNPRLAPGTQGILRPACCGAVSSVSKSTCECFCLWYHTQPSREGELLECPPVTRVGAPKGAALFEWPALQYLVLFIR